MEAKPKDYALFYAGLGWQVFPVHSVIDVDQCTCGNSGCDHQGKHPRTKNGLKDATDDEERIAAWWDEHPESNVGVATGSESGIWVVDVDKKLNGLDNWEKFVDGRELGTCEQITGSGGRHLIFAWDDSAGEVRNRTNMLPGVDVRGEGGYIIVPASNHLSGNVYSWIQGSDPSSLDPVIAPDWLLEHALSNQLGAPIGGRSHAVSGGLNPALLTGALPAGEIRSIRSALGAISPDCDRDTWVRVGMALESTGAGEQAFTIWDEWSAGATRLKGSGRAPVYPGAEGLRQQWNSFHRRDEEIRLSSLFFFAQEAGWQGTFEENGDGRVAVQLPPPKNAVRAVLEPIGWVVPEWIWGRHQPPPFPIEDAYPESLWWLREWVKALSWTFQMPPDFPALMSVAMAMGAVGGKYTVSVPRVQWREHAVFWVICAMPSGMGKSLAFEPLVKPFREFEAGLKETDIRATYEAQLRICDIRVRSAEKNMASKSRVAANNPILREDLEENLKRAMMARELCMANRPQSPRVLVSDATSEALAEFLEEHYGRALVADPEGGVFDHALGGSNKAPRLDIWLKSYSGETIDERRVGQAGNPKSKGRYVQTPLVSVAVATQPKALGPLFGNELAGAKGFLARFLTVIVPPELPEEFVREGLLPSTLVDQWRVATHRLLNSTRPTEPIDIPLSEEARELFVHWGQGELNTAKKGSTDDAESYLSAWNAKFRGKVLRLALVLHVLAHENPGTMEIGADTMRATLQWLPYLRAHNDLVSAALRDDPDLVIAERVLSWLEARDLAGEPFTRGALFKGLKGGNTAAVRRVDDLNGPLTALADSGWIRALGRLEQRRNGIASAKRYEAHPDLVKHLVKHRAAEAELGRTLGRRGL